jgi:S-(hydroxymethyl)glutathione dehydrogenase/alcohol dehydrogenase
MAESIIAKAAVLYRAGGPLRIEEVVVAAPGPGEVRVQMKAAGVCHSDLHVMRGELPMPVPVIPGHEGSGVVESVGPGVTSVRPGDRVIPIWRTSCGRCTYCLSGRPALCDVGSRMRTDGTMPDGTRRFTTRDGRAINHYAGVSTFASVSVIPEAAVVKTPDDYGFDHAALLGCGVITGVGAVTTAAKVEPGSTVAVFGAGGVGLNIIQGARMVSARRIIAIDRNAAKETKARELGATDFVVAGDGVDTVAAVRELTGGRGVDFAFESAGLPQVVEHAYDSTRKGGTCVAAGLSRPDARAMINVNQLVYGEKTLRGTLYGSMRPSIDLPMLIDLHRAGKLELDALLTRTYPLEQINEAYEDLERGELARGLIIYP